MTESVQLSMYLLIWAVEYIIYGLETLIGLKPLYFKQTAKKTLKVGRFKQGIYLSFGSKLYQSLLYTNGDVPLNVWHAYLLAPYFVANPETKRILLLGLGGGATAIGYQRFFPDYQVTAIEIDQDVIDLAKRYFQLPDKIVVHCADAVSFIKQDTAVYDAIIVDVFDRDAVLPDVTAASFLKDVHSHLTNYGIMVINFLGKQSVLRQLIDTLEHLGLTPFVLPVGQTSMRNMILFASKGKLALEDVKRQFSEEKRNELQQLVKASGEAIKKV